MECKIEVQTAIKELCLKMCETSKFRSLIFQRRIQILLLLKVRVYYQRFER